MPRSSAAERAAIESRRVEKVYAALSRVYDGCFDWALGPGRRQAVGQLPAQPGDRVLEVSVGTGLSFPFYPQGCHVTGVDLPEEFCRVAALLTARAGLAERIRYRQASALEMPFDEAVFDGAYSIHAAMNIADKQRLYAEIARVVKPGGLFGLYDVLQGPGGAPHYPVPWAEDPATSFLATSDELCDLIAAAGFEVVASRDLSTRGLASTAERRARLGEGAPPPLGPQIIMGSNYREKIANLQANLEQARIAPWEIICRKV